MTTVRQELNAQPTKIHATSSIHRTGRISLSFSMYRFFFGQLRIVDLAGSVVEDHDQIVPALILKPLVIAAVDMQHHPRQWTPLAPLAMHAAPGLALHQAGCLQGLFYPRVAQPDLMFLAELLMKVPHVQIEVLVPVKAQNLFGLRLRHPPAAWLAPSPVQ